MDVESSERYVTVAKFLEPVNAQMAKGMLESAGIECFLQGENANNLLSDGVPGAAAGACEGRGMRRGSCWRIRATRRLRKKQQRKAWMTFADEHRPRAVVCLSGGMDSCVCAALAARDTRCMRSTSAMGSGRRRGSSEAARGDCAADGGAGVAASEDRTCSGGLADRR